MTTERLQILEKQLAQLTELHQKKQVWFY